MERTTASENPAVVCPDGNEKSFKSLLQNVLTSGKTK